MKMTKWKWTLGILAIATTAYAAVLTRENTAIIGDGNPATNKSILMGEGIIRWTGGTSRLQFSNDDGTSFKDIGAGAGGGGGINLNSDLNFDCEADDPPVNYTASGGTFVAETINPGFGAQSCSWNSNAASQTLRTPLVDVPVGLEAANCLVQIDYLWESGVAGDLLLKAIDSGANELVSIELDPTTGTWRKAFGIFSCPTSEQVRLSIESSSGATDPALLVFDNVHLGSNIREVQSAESSIIAHAAYTETANCVWDTTSASLAAFPVDADCPSITVYDSSVTVDTADDDLPNIVFPNLAPGVYEVSATYTAEASSLNTSGSTFAISDGTSIRGNTTNRNSSATTVPQIAMHTSAIFSYTSAGARTFSMFASTQTGSARINVDVATNQERTLTWTVKRFPLQTETAYKLSDANPWNVDVNIGGANAALGTGDVSDYTEITDSTLDLVVNTGSVSAQIPCSSTNPSTGLTCSAGDESLGVAVTIPFAGKYEVCGEFTHESDITGSNPNAVFATFQWVETPNNAQTILQEGQSRVQSGFSQDPTDSDVHLDSNALHVCGQFTFNSVGQKTLRLMYEQDVTGTITSSNVVINRAATRGQRDMHVTMRPLSQNFPMPVILDSITTPSSGSGDTFALFSTEIGMGGPTLNFEYGDWIQSVVSGGTGITTITFKSVFSGNPMCSCNPINSDQDRACSVQVTSSTAATLRFYTPSTDTALDGTAQVMCHGPR